MLPQESMVVLGLSLAKPMLQDARARSGGKALTVLSLLIGLCVTLILSLALFTLDGSRQHSLVQEPAIEMASLPRPARAQQFLQKVRPGQFIQPVWAWQSVQSLTNALTPPKLVPSGSWHAWRSNTIKAQASEGPSVPEVWRAGPADVSSGQAQMALHLLKEEPHLFDDNVDQQLQALSEQQQQEEQQALELKDTKVEENQLVLRRKMQEVRRNERNRAVTELMYLKVCNRFRDLQVPLIPTLKGGGDIKFGVVDLSSLTTSVYSGDAMELVREHLFRIIGQAAPTAPFMGGMAVVKMPLFEAGQVYAMSCLFGYSLRKADERFQLEKLAGNFGSWGAEVPAEPVGSPFAEEKTLKNYIQAFGPEEAQRMLSITSMEARTAMELQVTALFGDLRAMKDKFVQALGNVESPEEAQEKLIQAVANNAVESIRITSEDLTRLVLEACTYGSLLNDEEKRVGEVYELTPRSGRPFQSAGPFLPGGDDDDPPPPLLPQ